MTRGGRGLCTGDTRVQAVSRTRGTLAPTARAVLHNRCALFVSVRSHRPRVNDRPGARSPTRHRRNPPRRVAPLGGFSTEVPAGMRSDTHTSRATPGPTFLTVMRNGIGRRACALGRVHLVSVIVPGRTVGGCTLVPATEDVGVPVGTGVGVTGGGGTGGFGGFCSGGFGGFSSGGFGGLCSGGFGGFSSGGFRGLGGFGGGQPHVGGGGFGVGYGFVGW